jgi:outer membrane receptor protein involved in Fe transport
MRFIFLNILLFVSIVIFAQNPNQNRPQVHVAGIVLEKVTNYPLEYATLIFTPEKGQVNGGISDVNGKFDISIPVGNYKVTVEFLSYKTIDLGMKKITQNLNLGTIYMESETETLGEVEIVAEKSTVEVKLDKKIYNVGKDMTVKGGTATDVLDNVPSVSVDVEGNVSLRGNESVRILIDGKPSGLVGLSATDALRQLPADAIQKVEVITSPSARYDAEGTAGIINIVLRKGTVTGFNASVSLNTGIPDNHGVSVNLNNRNKYFNLFSNLGYSYRKSIGNSLYYNYVGSELNKLTEETIETERTRKGFNGNIGLEYFLGEKASVTGSVLYRKSPNSSYATAERNVYGTDPELYLRWEDQNENDQVMEYALNFTQKFKKDDHKWTIDLKYEDDKEVENYYITENLNNTGTVPNEKNLKDENQKSWLIKSDYVLPLGEKQQFEAGFQANLDKSSIDYIVNEYENGTFVLNTDVSNLLKSNQNIYSAYLQYGTKWNQLSALFGLRMEHTYIFLDGQETVDYPNIDIDKKYTNLFPTLNLTYELKENENITAGFNRRIRRPHDRQLNPFESRTSETNVFRGNPDLDPVISYTADIGYYKKWNQFSLNTSAYYQYANNAIQMVRVVTPEIINGTNKIMTTPINLNSETRIGSELTLTYSPIKMIQLSNTFNFFKYKTLGTYENINYGTDNYSWNDRFAAKAKLSKKSDFQFTMTYEGPYESSRLRRYPVFVSNAAYSVDVLKDNGTISFNASDIFNTRYRQVYNYDPAFSSYAKMQWMPRQFNLNFTYRLNQKKKQNKPQPTREDNGGEDMI